MKLDRLPRVGEALKVDGKLCRITEVETTIDLNKAVLKVDIIGHYEMLSKPITVEFKWEEQ